MKGEATTADFNNNPGTVLVFNITENIRKKLGRNGKRIESIKVVRFSDRLNTRGVYVCTEDDDVLEEIAPTPLQACGLVTIMNGKFVLIESGGETSLHFANASSEDDVIDLVHMLSEENGLADGIKRYKQMTKKISPFNDRMMATAM
ncbi:MAG: hypothetical protein A4E28_01198 [Methanocella sp. PtaU1.Bin125]|nr:MAG: hypothetical protein A4E28_01198 [Methanocella sp. PtaU1.Bin125]